jgi:hypothetical protein
MVDMINVMCHGVGNGRGKPDAETKINTMNQTKYRGSDEQEYQIYLRCANDGNGGDITRNGAPLKTFEEWINS